MTAQRLFLSVCLNPTLQKTIVLDSLCPDEVNRALEHRLDSSGKGVNVSRVLTQLGANVVHLTHAGGRDRGLFLGLCRRDGIAVRSVPSGSEIRYCHTLLDRKARTSTEIVEESAPVGPGTERGVRRAFELLIPRVHTLVISGSKADGYSDSLFPWMVGLAKAAGSLVILDVRGRDLLNSLPLKPDLVKPNVREFCETFPETGGSENTDPGTTGKVGEKMRELTGRYGAAFVLTRGPGTILYTAGGTVRERRPAVIEAVNPIGSGDAFAAGLAFGIHRGDPLETALALAEDCAIRNALILGPGRIRETGDRLRRMKK